MFFSVVPNEIFCCSVTGNDIVFLVMHLFWGLHNVLFSIFSLVYSTDVNGESFTTFRSLICNTGPTILVIKDKDNHIFGGYASTDWHVGPKFFGSSNISFTDSFVAWIYINLNDFVLGDERCFLFSLQPVMKIYPTLPHNDHFLYLNVNQKSLPNGLVSFTLTD